jgi:beta-glucanase (GH16 family)
VIVTHSSLLGDVKDEIDYEFVGADLDTAQTNIYWEALPYYGNTGNISNITDTYANFHTYTIDWQQDQIEWSVDGVVKRTKTRASTWNSTSQLYNYPQTPCRVQLSIWPGGASNQAQGTIDWAGGAINWNSQDIQQAGYYYMQVQEVDVQCYPPPQGAQTQGNGSVSYVYDDKTTSFLNNSIIRTIPFSAKLIAVSDKGTSLLSQLGSGTNTTAALPSGASSSANPNPSGNQPAGGGSAEGNRGSGSGSGNGDGGNSPGSAGTGSTTGFSQGGGTSQASTFRGLSQIVAVWSAVVGLAVGGMFALL